MKNCVFTICAKNYIGLAKALKKSFLRYNTDTDVYIVVADEFVEGMPDMDPSILEAKSILNIDEEIWTNMTFKYNLTEFCTAIKPFSFEYFMSKGYEKVIYMDPDTYMFDSFSYVYNELDKYLWVTAPHITIPEYPYTGDLPDTSFLFNGISNFGFCAVCNHPKVLNIMRWWQDRLKKQCFGEMLWALCVDQKWSDFLPAFLEPTEIHFSSNLGLNVAPWNYFERKVIKENGLYYVVSRSGLNNRKDKLVFAHFAGYNYKEFAEKGEVNNKSRIRINTLKEYDDIKPLLDEYIAYISDNRETFKKYLGYSYSYGAFSNGVQIEKFHRRLYNGLCTNFEYSTINPFDANHVNSYYELLKSKGMISEKKSIVSGSLDSATPDTVAGYGKKLKFIYKALRVFYRIIGYERYILFLQFVRRLSLYEINTFLLGKEFENYKLR